METTNTTTGVERKDRYALRQFGVEIEVTVENITQHSTGVYVGYSSLGQMGGRIFSSMKIDEFLTKATRLAGYRFRIPATLGTEVIVVDAPNITLARRAATQRGQGRAAYVGYAYANPAQ